MIVSTLDSHGLVLKMQLSSSQLPWHLRGDPHRPWRPLKCILGSDTCVCKIGAGAWQLGGCWSAEMQTLYWYVVVKGEFSWKGGFCWSVILLPPTTAGGDLRVRLQTQAAETNFLCRVSGLSLRDKVRSLDTRRRVTGPPPAGNQLVMIWKTRGRPEADPRRAGEIRSLSWPVFFQRVGGGAGRGSGPLWFGCCPHKLIS